MAQTPTIFVTGGAGFIGSNFVLRAISDADVRIVNIDKLTYAANLENLRSVQGNERHIFKQADIKDAPALRELFQRYPPAAVLHFAAESHVDRSILGPAEFVETNVKGTFTLLEEARIYWSSLTEPDKGKFRLVHVSTDEVYGSLSADEPAFTEAHSYRPNSPYSASKAGADHLARAYHHTYGLPTIITNCSNNYGPYQFPEKLLPLVILNAISGKPIPIYGDGQNVRDWLFVEDHCEALAEVLKKGKPGETYNIGGNSESTNLELVNAVCELLDAVRPSGEKYLKLITFVKDRPGHDRRYAIDSSKIRHELGWQPRHSLATGLQKTVNWYLDNEEWIRSVQTGAYKEWIDRQYSSRVL